MTAQPEWCDVALSELLDFRNGINFLRSSTGAEVRILGVGDFGDNESIDDFSTLKTVTVSSELAHDDLLEENDLVFVRSNGNRALVGRCALIRGIAERVTFSGFTIRGRLKSDQADPVFLSKVLRSDLFAKHLRLHGGGSSISNLSQGVLAEFSFSLPPLPEQRKIAEILRAWDDAIEGLQQLRKSQTARREAMISKLLFGGGHPHGTTWARTARDWTIRPIGDLAKEAGARNAGLSAEAVLTCSKHLGFVRSEDYFGRTVHSKDLSNYKLVHRDEFAFPSNHVEEGSIGLQNVVDTGAVSPIYTVFVFNRELIDPRFAYLVLKSQHYTHMFRVSTSATVDRRGSLRWPEFSRLPFPVPPMRMQERIVEVAKDFDDDLARTSTLIALYRDQKRGLMQKLLTGEIRVTGNVAASLRGASVV